MKKVLVSSLMLIFAGAATVSANVISKAPYETIQEEKVKIKNEELPEAVQNALSGDSYQGWTISAAYQIKSSEQYEIELTKDSETKTVKFDKEGKEVE
jgi:hypothetical protein